MNTSASPEMFKLSIGDKDYAPMTLDRVEANLYVNWPDESDIWETYPDGIFEFFDEKNQHWEILGPDGVSVWAFFKKV
jgi:hypothetical protein